MLFYFSGTGNSKWIATQLSRQLHEKLYFIPELLKEHAFDFTLAADEKIGFVFPVYSWSLPPIVSQFIGQLSFSNYNGHYCFFVCSCGDDIGLTQQVFAKLMAAKGWQCIAGFSVVMPNNYVLLPGFDVDSKDLERKKLKEAVGTLGEIAAELSVRSNVFRCEKGSFPFIKTRIINPLFNRFQMSPANFWVTDDCIACRRCMKSCPVGNIMMEEGRPCWGRDCTSCLACFHVCPRQAVQYGTRTKGKGHYLNPDYFLSDADATVVTGK